MQFTTQVLISGAGPTGLMMACQLKRFGIDCIVVDEKKGITVESRALVVQARSLEIYYQMGLIEKVIEEGKSATGVNFIINGKRIQHLNFESIGAGLSPYAFLYILEQNENEKLLYEHLKELSGEVKWGNELTTFSQNNNEITAIVKDEHGNENTIQTDWLIAADGAKSFVRHFLQIPFEGATYENEFVVADTATDGIKDHDKLSLCLSDKTFVGLFPMKGENRFRLVGRLPDQFRDKEIHSFDEIKNVIEEETRTGISFRDTNWFSVYKIHHRMIGNFKKQRVFLAGDAAHVHSPVGGQGMNTGLQDAYNLAWKLALVLNKKAGEKLLDSYNEERIPVARALVKTTDRAFSFITSQKKINKFLRLKILPALLKNIFKLKAFRVFAFRNLSQIAISYRRSALSYNSSGNLLSAGKFVPYVEINSKKISEILRYNGFTILVFGCLPSREEKEILQDAFLVPMQFIVIAKTKINDEAYKKFKVDDCGVFVIRPDNYIGFTSENFLMKELKTYFSERVCLK